MNGLGLGLLHADFRSPDQIDAQAQAEDLKRQAMQDALGSHLHGLYCEWRDARREKEEEWLEDLRAYSGIYEAREQMAIKEGRSDVYVHLTRTKVKAAYNRIVDLLFQSSDKHWSIDPTPIPEGEAFLDAWTNEPLPIELVREVAEMVAKAMNKQMEDHLAEAGYEKAVKQAAMEACVLGTGAVKGVTVGIEQDQRWGVNAAGRWGLQIEEKAVPMLDVVSIFDLFPDPYATEVDDANGIFQRHIWTRSVFTSMAGLLKFDEAAVQDVLLSHANGNHTEEHHEIERRKIAGYQTSTGNNGRFEVLEYWGWVPGEQLVACGCPVEDPTADYQANVWMCGTRTLLARLTPQRPERVPYQIFPYERVPHQFWGVGVPRQMKDSQATMNASVRALLDNLGISSGPMVEVNMDLLAAGENPRDLHPWRVFLREGGDPSNPLLRFYSPENVTANLGQVVDMFRRFADEETSLPSYTHGQQTPGLNKTASGMSMLMGAANIEIKGIIKNIDDYLIKPLIESLYHWNMRWNPRQDIKGDMEVVARGSTTLVAKEVQSQRLMQFAQMTANPVDAQLTDRLGLLRQVAESLDIDADKVIRNEQDFPPTPFDAAGGPGGAGPGGAPGMGGVPGLPGPAAGAMQGSA